MDDGRPVWGAGHVAVLHCSPDAAAARRWGDAHFARAVADAIQRSGGTATVHMVPEWTDPAVADAAVVVHLRGRTRWPMPARQPGRRRVLWLISHPDDVTTAELDDFDLVAVASHRHAKVLDTRTSTPVAVLLQASDLHRFRPPGLVPPVVAGGIVVVANARWPYRRGPRWLDELGWPYTLYGANWDGRPEQRHWTGGFVPNDLLPAVYAGAAVVVADQWGEMSRQGFVANRLFDVAACGGFVIADEAPGIAEVFGDAVPTYSTRADLDALLRHHLPRPAARASAAHRAMVEVRRHHGFDHRVRRLGELLDRVERGERLEASDRPSSTGPAPTPRC